jgi:hypothetical protein
MYYQCPKCGECYDEEKWEQSTFDFYLQDYPNVPETLTFLKMNNADSGDIFICPNCENEIGFYEFELDQSNYIKILKSEYESLLEYRRKYIDLADSIGIKHYGEFLERACKL